VTILNRVFGEGLFSPFTPIADRWCRLYWPCQLHLSVTTWSFNLWIGWYQLGLETSSLWRVILSVITFLTLSGPIRL